MGFATFWKNSVKSPQPILNLWFSFLFRNNTNGLLPIPIFGSRIFQNNLGSYGSFQSGPETYILKLQTLVLSFEQLVNGS